MPKEETAYLEELALLATITFCVLLTLVSAHYLWLVVYASRLETENQELEELFGIILADRRAERLDGSKWPAPPE